jgi:hypothetical protein
MNFTAKIATGLLLASLAPYFTPAKAQQVPIKQGPIRQSPNLRRSVLGGNVQNQWVQCAVGATYVWWNPAWPAPYNTAAHAQAVCNTFYGGVGAHQTAPTSGGPSNTPGQFNPTYAYPPSMFTNGVLAPWLLDLMPFDVSIDPAIANAQAPVFPPVEATYNAGQALKCGTAQNGGVYALKLNTGTANWSVKGPNYPAAIPSVAYANGAWPTNLITAASWISANTDEMAQPDGGYLFSTDFTVPTGAGATSVSVAGKFLADNQAVIFIDGIPVSTSLGQPMFGFYPAALTSFYYALPSANPGIHKIQILVRNLGPPMGLRAEVTVRRTCALT